MARWWQRQAEGCCSELKARLSDSKGMAGICQAQRETSKSGDQLRFGDIVMFHFDLAPLTQEEIKALAERYWSYTNEKDRQKEKEIVEWIAPLAKRRGWFERDEFLKICRWKSKRPSKHYERNTDEEVKRATSAAFSVFEPETCVMALMELHGVGLPVASVLLHFGHRDNYPILDERACKALGCSKKESMAFWRAYVNYSRDLAKQYTVSMRILDRALWTHGKELSQTAPDRFG